MYHWALHWIHAHVFLTILALLLERMAEEACGATWRTIRDDLQQIKLAQVSGPNGTVWQITEPRPAARNRWKVLGIPNPTTLLAHA